MIHLTVVPIPHQRSGWVGPVLSLHLGCVSLSWHRCLRRHLLPSYRRYLYPRWLILHWTYITTPLWSHTQINIVVRTTKMSDHFFWSLEFARTKTSHYNCRCGVRHIWQSTWRAYLYFGVLIPIDLRLILLPLSHSSCRVHLAIIERYPTCRTGWRRILVRRPAFGYMSSIHCHICLAETTSWLTPHNDIGPWCRPPYSFSYVFLAVS